MNRLTQHEQAFQSGATYDALLAEMSAPADGSARWQRSEWPHPLFPNHMKTKPLPNVIWLRFHGNEVTGYQTTEPNPQP